MARNVTLGTMQTRVQRLADIESATTRFPLSELTDYINEGIAHFYDIVRGVFGEDYFRSAYSFSTSNGTDTYALPTDFVSLISVDVTLTSTSVLTARPYTEQERNVYKWFPIGWVFGQPIYYRLMAGNIRFIPSPTGSYSVTLNYVPTPTTLVNTNDTFDGINGWDEYVALWAAKRCAIKDENYDLVGYLDGQLAAVQQNIERLAPQRDAGANDRVMDVYVGAGWGTYD